MDDGGFRRARCDKSASQHCNVVGGVESAMKYIEAPDLTIDVVNMPTVFLAGGITGCSDWQQEMVELLADTEYLLANPRRKNFPIGNPEAAEEQIKWEWRVGCNGRTLLCFGFQRNALPYCAVRVGGVVKRVGQTDCCGNPSRLQASARR